VSEGRGGESVRERVLKGKQNIKEKEHFLLFLYISDDEEI